MIRFLWALLCRVALIAAVLLFLVGIGAVCFLIPWLPVVVVMLVVGLRSRHRWRGGWSHGTARVASVQELRAWGMLAGNDGIILGRALAEERASRWKARTRPVLALCVLGHRLRSVFLGIL